MMAMQSTVTMKKMTLRLSWERTEAKEGRRILGLLGREPLGEPSKGEAAEEDSEDALDVWNTLESCDEEASRMMVPYEVAPGT